MNPLVSVIIPTYNSARFVAESVVGALHQEYEPMEIIVIDDGSSDSTSAVLDQFAHRIRRTRQENRGVAAARNTGIQLSTGALIAFLDADDQWLPGKLSIQCSMFANYPHLGLVHTNAYFWRPAANIRTTRDDGQEKYVGHCYEALVCDNRILTSSVVVRRACLDKVGLFDEHLAVGEDWDLWIRISRYFEVGYEPTPLVLYRLHEDSLSTDSLRMRKTDLVVIKAALERDPELSTGLGAARLKERLFRLNSELGYVSFERKEYHASSVYFKDAIIHRRTRSAVFYYLVSLFPGSFIESLRYLKQVLRVAARAFLQRST